MDEIKQMVEEYVERYSKTRGISREEAFDHLIVKYYAAYCAEENKCK